MTRFRTIFDRTTCWYVWQFVEANVEVATRLIAGGEHLRLDLGNE